MVPEPKDRTKFYARRESKKYALPPQERVDGLDGPIDAKDEHLVPRSARARLKNTEPYARTRPRTALRDLRPSLKGELTTDQTTKKRPSE